MSIDGSARQFTCVVFAGQGSQRPCMGLDFVEASPEARAVFGVAREVLSFDPTVICLGTDERLGLTEYAQPAILTMEIAVFEALRARFGLAPRRFGGHSLGEYSALVAAGAIPLETALRLVALRGALMQAATPPGVGLMAAMIMDGLPLGVIRQAAAHAEIDLANDNSPTQVVLSGLTAAVEEVLRAFADYERTGALRIVRLATSAPFHSRHMRGIETAFRSALEDAAGDFVPARATAVVSNWTGQFYGGGRAELIDNLVRQLAGTVRWQDNMKALLAKEAGDAIVEIAPDRTLRSFFAALDANIPAVTDLRSAERAFRPVASSKAA